MAYTFDQIFAADPSNPERVASNGVVTIFAPGDETRTPLAISSVDGMSMQNPVQVNDSGHGPAFVHETLDRVAWEGGGFSGFLTSYEGMKAEAVAARVSAGEAAVAAAEAAANTAAPTAAAVEREIITEGAPARAAVEIVAGRAAESATASALIPIQAELATVPAQIESGVEPIKAIMSAAADPFAYFDSMKLLCEFPTRENGETFWPQGFSLDAARDRIYVANNDSLATALRIDVRQLSTGERIESKTFSGFLPDSFSEACPWFFNAAGDLCFVVFAKSTTNPTSICTINYTRGTVGPIVPLVDVAAGTSKADVSGEYFIVADAGGTTANAFVVYTWESVKAGAPVMVSRITAEQSNGGTTFMKNQGLGVVGGNFFLIQGAQSEHPAITSYDKHGRIRDVRSYPKPTFGRMVNKLAPEKLQIPQDTFFFEAEGATNLNGRLVSGFIVGNNTFTKDSRFLILAHGHVDGVLATPAATPSYVYDTGWVTLTPLEGWGANPPVQVRRRGGEVQWRGELFNANQEPGGYSAAVSIPAGFRPQVDTRLPQTYSAIPMAVRVDASGTLRCWTNVKTGTPRPLNGIRYSVD